MGSSSTSGIIIFSIIVLVVLIAAYFISSSGKNLNSIKSKPVGDGQFGDQHWATKQELNNNLVIIPYEPEKWRNGENRPQLEGIILGAVKNGKKVSAYIDISDNHTLSVSAPGGGKTSSFVYPNLEFLAAVGNPFFVTDTKGDAHQTYAPVLEKYYGYKTYVIDLRNPTRSDSYNLMYLVNKYNDRYESTKSLADKARAETYAKVLSNSIVHMDGFKSAGQNQYFYESAEGIITGVILLVSELCEPEEKHIVSVFKIIEQLLEIDPRTVNKKGVMPTTYLTELYTMLPTNHKAKWFMSATASGAFQTTASVMSTAMSRMLSFIDTEMEQMICFNSDLDIENFINGKQAIFFVVDEKSSTKNFLVSLLVRQTYNELLCASEHFENNKLPHRVYYYLDEFGTYTAIERVDQMFSAGRSRGIICCPFLQTTTQLDQKYDQNTASVIKSSCQNVMFSYIAPTSPDAETFSKMLDNQTVMSGSVSQKQNSFSNNNNANSVTYNMTKKPLMTPGQIKRMKKGDWVLMKTGMHPAQMKLLKSEDWGLSLNEEPYKAKKSTIREVSYADRTRLFSALLRKYPTAKAYTPPVGSSAEPVQTHEKKPVLKTYI